MEQELILGGSAKKFIVSPVCGFCGGVRRAAELFDGAVSSGVKPVYILHELVHNNFYSRIMTERGAVFVEAETDIPDGATAMIGAHGVSPCVENALRRRCKVIDATCPKVKMLQKCAANITADRELIMLCKPRHPEAVGVLGFAGTSKVFQICERSDTEHLPEIMKSPVLLVQTTVSGNLVDEVSAVLRSRYPNLEIPVGICESSKKRQESVRELASVSQCVLVIGSSHSSNAVELVNAAQQDGVPAHLVESAKDITSCMLERFSVIGITAGASTPDELISDVKSYLVSQGFVEEPI